MLGENISKFRKKAKLSQEELAELMECTRQTISNWELGETSPTAEQVIELSKIFKVSSDELLGLDNRDILSQRVIKTEKIVKRQNKLFLGIYIIVLALLLGVGIYFFTLKDFTKNNQEGIECELKDRIYNLMLSPGLVKQYNKETKKFEPYESYDYLWKMYVKETDITNDNVIYEIEFSAGYSYKEAIDSINLVKKKIISQGGICR